LRPGADLNRSESDLAGAEIQAIQARQSVAITRASLAQFTGCDPATVQLAKGRLLDAASSDLQPLAASTHPLLMEQRAATEEAAAKLKEYERAYFPKFLLQGAGYARGTGAIADGTTLNGANGLGPNIFNWGLGFSVLFPVLDLPGIRAKRLEQQAEQRAETAKEQQISQELTANVRKAQAALEGARLVAQKTPLQLSAAQKTLEQLTARYKSGLGTLIEVADAQRLVAQAEIDDSLARLQVWRALLAVAVAQGDLDPFLKLAAQ
jgi:outer membrane protein TolC